MADITGKKPSEFSAATIESLHKALTVGVKGNTVFVDDIKGNDLKAITDASIPFKTLGAAFFNSNNCTIVVHPGIYTHTETSFTLLKAGINWHFENGAKIYAGESTLLFSDEGGITGLDCKVTGYGEFFDILSYGKIINLNNAGNKLYFESINMYVEGADSKCCVNIYDGELIVYNRSKI